MNSSNAKSEGVKHFSYKILREKKVAYRDFQENTFISFTSFTSSLVG
jgi:hypothetical protein